MDTGENVKKRLGEQLKVKRMAAGLSVVELADLARKYLKKDSDSRTYIHALEGGRGNSTIENYAMLFGLCGSSLDSVLTGFWQNDELEPEQVRLQDQLTAIMKYSAKHDRNLLVGLEVVIGAMIGQVNHLKKGNKSPESAAVPQIDGPKKRNHRQ